ncbi:MAG: nucleotidyltransferase [Crocinitomicaceae bacterium]|nr:nucleotidyltransferase [Crocinitomicaceae bacterium]|tara:strand:+ start:2051 stop:2950 length:900 start_codon:yes stop_codon:yes gene_type:complete
MKPTLLILAAGMGSRYGGLKQIDGIGPNEEPIIEYSIYDAIKAGFGKIVFVIRKEFDEAFRSRFDQFSSRISIEYVYQPVNVKVDGINTVERTKPWGTSHAVLVAKDVIKEPFAVINADDYYGANSFKLISNFLMNECSPTKMAMIGYILSNTLSDHGTVNRGVCEVDENNFLIEVNERVKLANQNGKVIYNIGSDDPVGEVAADSSVSMNYWGFHPSIFSHIEAGLHEFMDKNNTNPTAEYYIPDVVTDMIVSGKMNVEVIPTSDNWFGVTYKEDKSMAVETLNKHIQNGVYPKNLWT